MATRTPVEFESRVTGVVDENQHSPPTLSNFINTTKVGDISGIGHLNGSTAGPGPTYTDFSYGLLGVVGWSLG